MAVERLRTVGREAAALADDCQAAGLSVPVMLEAIRAEHADWDVQLPLMEKVGDLLAASGSRTRLDLMILVDDPIASASELADYERNQGRLAFHIRKAITECPYGAGSPSAVTWREGWLEGRAACR